MAVAVLLVIILAWTSVDQALSSAPSMTLFGSVDKSEVKWGEVQKFQFKLTLPAIPATDKIDLTLSFTSHPLISSTRPLHIYKLDINTPATATIGTTYGPFFTDKIYNSYLTNVQYKAHINLEGVHTSAESTVEVNVETFNPSRWTNDNDGYPRTFDAVVASSNTNLYFSTIKSPVLASGYSKSTSITRYGWGSDDKNLKLYEARVFKFKITSYAPSAHWTFEVGPKKDEMIDMYHLGQMYLDLPGAEVPERNRLDRVEVKSTLSASGKVTDLKIYQWQLYNPNTAWGSKWELNMYVPVLALKPGEIELRIYSNIYAGAYSESSSSSWCSDVSFCNLALSISNEVIDYPAGAFSFSSEVVTKTSIAAFSSLKVVVTATLGAGQSGNLEYTGTIGNQLTLVGAVLDDIGNLMPHPTNPANLAKGGKADVEMNGNAFTVSYGKVIAPPPKDLVVKIVMMLQVTSAAPASWTPTFTVGSQTVTATGLAVQASDSVSKPTSGLKAEYQDIGSWTHSSSDRKAAYKKLYKGWTQGVGVKVTVPNAFFASKGTMDFYPHYSNVPKLAKKLAFEVVPLEVDYVGSNLPCMAASKFLPQTSMSSTDLLYKDQSMIPLPAVCSGPSAGSLDDNAFLLRVIYKMTGDCQSTLMKWRGGVDLLPGGVVIFTVETYAGYSISSSSFGMGQYEFHSNYYFASYKNPNVYALTPRTTSGITEIVEGSIFHTSLLMKFHPIQRGNFVAKVVQTKSDLGFFGTMVCKIAVGHVGKNLLYRVKPEAEAGKNPSSEITYEGDRLNWEGDWTSLTQEIQYRLTSWAKKGHKVNRKAVIDDDTFEIQFFFKVKDGSSLDGNGTRYAQMSYERVSSKEASSSSDKYSGSTSYGYSVVAKEVPTTSTSEDTVSLNPTKGAAIGFGPLASIYSGVPKIVPLVLTLPKTLEQKITVRFINANFDSKVLVDLCSIHITKVGKNWPCLDQETTFTFSNGSDIVTDADQEFARFISIEIDPAGHYAYSSLAEDDQLHIELTFRPTKETGTTVAITAEVEVGGDIETVDWTFHRNDIPQGVLSPGDISVPEWKAEGELKNNVEAGTRVWVPFQVRIPAGATLPLQLAVLVESDRYWSTRSKVRAAATVQGFRQVT